MTLPSHDLDALAQRLRRFEELCSMNGVDTQTTRVQRYRRYLEWLASEGSGGGWDRDTDIFGDPPETPIQHGLDRLLYVLREVHELAWVGEGLRSADTQGLATRLRVLVGGADFAALDRNTESRNTQFELRIASYLGRAGYHLDFDSLTDIVASRGCTTYYVECKRVASPSQLRKRIKQAFQQLEKRKPNGNYLHGCYGIVAVDVTRVAYAHNGLALGVTSDHARDTIQDKLRDIEAQVMSHGPALAGSPAIALWLQIHIPSLILNPPTPTTRFSSLYWSAPNLGLRARCAGRRFIHSTIRVATLEPGDQAPRPLRRRSEISIPENTRFTFDEEVLRTLVQTGDLPERPDDHVVLTVIPPGGAGEGVVEYYSHLELAIVLESLPVEDRRLFMTSLGDARLLVAPMILQRYRYITHKTWLDEAEEPNRP